MPRRRKLHILRFAFRGKSSVVPLLLLSPPNPLTLGFGGAPFLHCFRRSLLYCSNCGEFVGTERITGLICSRKLGGSMSVPIILGSAARRAHGSSAEHAMRDLIASHAPLREGRHTARQNGPKHYPRGFKGPQPLDTPFSPIFRRATKDGATGGRWFSREVGKKRTTKDGAVGDRRSSIAASNKIKTQNSP